MQTLLYHKKIIYPTRNPKPNHPKHLDKPGQLGVLGDLTSATTSFPELLGFRV